MRKTFYEAQIIGGLRNPTGATVPLDLDDPQLASGADDRHR